MFHDAILQPYVVRSQQLIVVLNAGTITTMSSSEKNEFAARMNTVADLLDIPQKGKNRQKLLGDKFGVSQEAARKWLEGESFPATEKAIEIAKRAEVNYEWLMTGRGLMRGSFLVDQEAQAFKQLPAEVRAWILKNAGVSPPAINPTNNGVETAQAPPIELAPKRFSNERRQRENPVAQERRKIPFTYKGAK